MKPVIIRPRAEAEIEDAFQWYENEQAGLGEAFRDILRGTLSTIAENPRFYPVLYRDTRRALLEALSIWGVLPRFARRHRRRGMPSRSS